jgi:hypothetical protein
MARLGNGMQLPGPDFPIVLKPDVAQRGSGFKVVRTAGEAQTYLREVAFRYRPTIHPRPLRSRDLLLPLSHRKDGPNFCHNREDSSH